MLETTDNYTIDETEELLDMMDAIKKYYDAHAEEIETATQGDSFNYIFRSLWRSLNFNAQANGTTRTIPNELVGQECRKQAWLIDNSTAGIAAALNELIKNRMRWR